MNLLAICSWSQKIDFLLYFRFSQDKRSNTSKNCFCGKSFRTVDDLLLHQELHCKSLQTFRKTGVISCEKCCQNFKYLIDLSNHKEECPYAITCSKCGLGFKRSEYSDHVLKESCFDLDKPYLCQCCNKRFSTFKSYAVHRDSCSTSPSWKPEIDKQAPNVPKRCTRCGKDFFSLSEWTRHSSQCQKMKKRDHFFKWRKNGNYCCSNCLKRFKKKQSLKSHYVKCARDSVWNANMRVGESYGEINGGPNQSFKQTHESKNAPRRYFSPIDEETDHSTEEVGNFFSPIKDDYDDFDDLHFDSEVKNL